MKYKYSRIIAIVVILFLLIITIKSISAYYTNIDNEVNYFRIGDVDIELLEPIYDKEKVRERTALEPDSDIIKDIQVKNIGGNSAYIFLEISIPNKEVMTANRKTGAREEKELQEMFKFEVNSEWQLVDKIKGIEYMKYIYAYTKGSDLLSELLSGETTETLFTDNKLHLINIIEGQNLSEELIHIPINVYAIQIDNITTKNTNIPKDVWNVLYNQANS